MKTIPLLLPAIMFGCVENELAKVSQATDGQPQLRVEPTEIYFGVVQPTLVASEVVTLTNDGDEAVELQSFLLEGAGFTAASAAPIMWLGPGDSTEFWIDYSPVFVEDTGWLTIESSDSSAAEVLIPLNGQGAYPLLILDPPVVDFGWVQPNEFSENVLTMRNDGLADLTITQSLVVGSDFAAPIEPTYPMTLAPGEEYQMDLVYTPLTLGEHTGSVWVESNSPAGTSQAQLIGGSSDKPIAECYVDPMEVAPLRQAVTWYGENSYDPSGAAITEYNWVMVTAPSGSTTRMPNGGANRYNFVPDLAGTYVAQLTVTNEHNRVSEPCLATLEAIPEESLWIEMFWTHSNDDMDLHLLAPGGSLETNNDCYYMNCVGGGWLDW